MRKAYRVSKFFFFQFFFHLILFYKPLTDFHQINKIVFLQLKNPSTSNRTTRELLTVSIISKILPDTRNKPYKRTWSLRRPSLLNQCEIFELPKTRRRISKLGLFQLAILISKWNGSATEYPFKLVSNAICIISTNLN